MSYHRVGCLCPPTIDIAVSGIDGNICSVCVDVSGSVLYKLKSVAVDGTHALTLVGSVGPGAYEYTGTIANAVTWETYTLGGGCDPGDYLGDVTHEADIRVRLGMGAPDDPCCKWLIGLCEIIGGDSISSQLAIGIFVGIGSGGKTCATAVKLGSTLNAFITSCPGGDNRAYGGSAVVDYA